MYQGDGSLMSSPTEETQRINNGTLNKALCGLVCRAGLPDRFTLAIKTHQLSDVYGGPLSSNQSRTTFQRVSSLAQVLQQEPGK